MADEVSGHAHDPHRRASWIDPHGSQGSRVFFIALFMLLLGFGIYLRFHGNDEKLFWYDEIHTALWYSGHDLGESMPSLANREIGVGELQKLWKIDEGSDLRAVIEGIVRDDPQHTPLYYVALRLWAGVAGDSIGSLRSLSAVAGLLLLPVMFWLCLELFGWVKEPQAGAAKRGSMAAWIAVALVAVSPFHFVYAQEARQYTLWMLTIILASALLLWTLRVPRTWKWWMYALVVAAGLYTHLLFCFVILSHGVYVFGMNLLVPNRGESGGLRPMAAYAAATVCGVLLFAPWIWVMTTHYATATTRVSWAGQETGILHLAGMWAYNYSAVFLDTNHALKYIDEPGLVVYGSFLLRVLILVPAFLAVLQLMREPARKASLFLLPLILLPFLGLALPDIFLGGMRSGGGNRYLAASFLGVQIALAYWLATGLSSTVARKRKLMTGTLAFILAMGVLSGIIFHHSNSWWHKTIGHFNMDTAAIINSKEAPLLIAGSATSLLSFSHSLDNQVRVLFAPDNDVPDIPPGYSDVFVLAPSEQTRAQLLSRPGLMLDEVFPHGDLYRVTLE